MTKSIRFDLLLGFIGVSLTTDPKTNQMLGAWVHIENERQFVGFNDFKPFTLWQM